MHDTVAVIGAGISGLLLARELTDRGARVVVLEKSRGFGGRLATKRVGEAVFDSGAQFFTVRSERLARRVAEWRARGVVAGWPGGAGGAGERMVGIPSMNAVGRILAEGLDVRRECRVTEARREDGGWELSVEQQPPIRVRWLALTAPMPQSLALLEAGGVTLPAALGAELQALRYHPCLALLLTLDGPSRVPPAGLALAEGPVRWLADNAQKGVSPGPAAAVTVHLSPSCSAEHYRTPAEELAARVLPGIERWLGAAVKGIALHRWKFSEPLGAYREPCVWLEDYGLGFAGDALGGPRVEGAATSGFALADRMLARMFPDAG